MIRGKLSAEHQDSSVLSGRRTFDEVYRDLRGYFFDYETDPESAARLVPEILDIPEPVRASLRFWQGAGGTLAPFCEVAQLIHVQHEGNPLVFVTRVITNSPRTYEMYWHLGFPVVMGAVVMNVEAGMFSGWAERPLGIRLCSAAMSIDRLDSEAPTDIVSHVSSARLVPGEVVNEIEVLKTTWTFRTRAVWSGVGQCHYTNESALDPLHQLPVRRILGSRCLVGDGVVNEANVVIGRLGERPAARQPGEADDASAGRGRTGTLAGAILPAHHGTGAKGTV